MEIAEISGGRFQPRHVSQQWNRQKDDDYEADYTLRFVFDGRCFEATLENLGDWYDRERLMMTANRALAGADHPERFITLHSGGRMANVTFGDPNKLRPLCAKLAIPMDDDPSQAMNAGKAFEQRVREELLE